MTRISPKESSTTHVHDDIARRSIPLLPIRSGPPIALPAGLFGIVEAMRLK